MTARIIALYGHPTDAAEFDRYYASTHVPLTKKLPGLRTYILSRGTIGALDGKAPYHLVAELTFDSVEEAQAAFGSAEGEAVVADLGNFASGGVSLMWYQAADA